MPSRRLPTFLTVSGYDRIFLAEAQLAALRAVESHSQSMALREAGAAASAILCAAAACEAWVSEYVVVEEALGDPKAEFIALRTERDALRQWKGLIKIRIPSFDCGASAEYRAVGCLLKLRDHVAHRSARFAPLNSFPKKLDSCVAQGTIPVRKAEGTDWTSVIFVHEVASWAAQTAGAWLDFADNEVASPRVRDRRSEMYKQR
jgi:hypothetical protein